MKKFCNKVFDWLYEFWYGYRRACARDPLFTNYAKPKVVPDNPQPTLKANWGGIKINSQLGEAMNKMSKRNSNIDFQEFSNPSEKKLWVYNVSRVDHTVDHPMLGVVTIPANTTKNRYSVWTSFPEVVVETNYNIDANELTPRHIRGDYFVDDLINPDNIYGDSKYSSSIAIGRDLSVRGVFWSYFNPPSVSEVNSAIQKMKARYADLLEKTAVLYEASQPNMDRAKKLMEEVRVDEDGIELPKLTLEEAYEKSRMERFINVVTPEHHVACEYFKVTTPWHPVLRG